MPCVTLSACAMKIAPWLIFFCDVASAAPHEGVADVTQVVVTARGNDGSEAAKPCKRFSLSAAGARSFLRRASIITTSERHHEFLWSPCFVSGTAVVGGRRVAWRIESLGVGVLTYENGEEVLLGDERQRDRSGQ
jgi:hypothetical protein